MMQNTYYNHIITFNIIILIFFLYYLIINLFFYYINLFINLSHQNHFSISIHTILIYILGEII